MNKKNRLSILGTCLVILTLAGCSTLDPVPINRSKPEELRSQLTVGKTVHVRLQSGEQHQFRIVALESDAIVGPGVRIAYRDIDLLELKARDYEGTTKTALALGALALVYIAAAVIEAELDEDANATTRCESNGQGGCIPR
jgi:hypothetical protein